MATTSPPKNDSCEAVLQQLSPEKRAAWIGFLQAHSLVTKALEADLIANFGLQLSAFEVLSRVAVADGGHLRMSDLAEQALLSQSRVSRLVTELEQRGLMQRRGCEKDTRVVYAGITDEGRELVERAQDPHSESIEERFFKGLSEKEISRLAELWPRVIEAAVPTAGSSQLSAGAS
jgi:DNA-binding MarR family transcriptional regulator